MTTGTVTTYDDLLENTDLAITFPDSARTERWAWRDQKMFKHGDTRGVDPFFFTGLLAQGKIVHGDFAPPQRGEWFTYMNNRRPHYHFFVVGVTAQKVELVYFISGEFGGWTETHPDRVLDEYRRMTEAPTVTPSMFERLAISALEYKQASESRTQQIRNMRDAQQNMRYARDYLNTALLYAEARTT